ncbi:MAG: ABC transporter ATP-binding protein [Planctomycetes bacterium]|nr:ABC transporter ATP-binding protein [Planctomycetota bacterium]
MSNDAPTALVECRGLTKVFRDFWLRPRVKALNGLDLEIRAREVFGLLGPNGSGKSTTIKLILGLLHPTAGRISVFGRLPSDVRAKAKIGYLPEESYLYRFLNARETLEYYGRLFELERSERRRRIDMLLEMVGLEAVQHRPVGEYSKGMQRRIGLAQALINDPELLILDEPTTGLDPIGTRQIKDLILHLKARGKTVLLCSHLLADVEDVCDRVTVLYGGRVRAQGTVDELLAKRDAVIFETEGLKPEEVEPVRALIESAGHAKVRRVEAPRKKLEALFLELVEQAHAEGATTHGAGAGGPVAGFLGAGAESAVAAEPVLTPAAVALTGTRVDREVLTELAQPAASQPVSVPAPAAEAQTSPPAADRQVLNKLLSGAETETPQPKPPAPAKPAQPLLNDAARVDRSVLDDLLDKDRRS